MALPALDIPQFPLPFHIPVEVHPCIVHLAVSLPIVIILIELVNLVVKKRTLGVFSFALMVLVALVLFGAYLTGTADAAHAKSALVGEAKSLFEAHRMQGIYLVYGAAVLVVVKLLSVLIRKTWMRVIFLIFLLAFTALTLNTAKKGKELVFDYGINVKTSVSGAAVANQPAAEAPSPEAASETNASESKKTPSEAAESKEELSTPQADGETASDTTPERPKATEEPVKKSMEPAAETPAKTEAVSESPTPQ